MAIVTIKATSTRRDGKEDLHFFGKTVSINTAQISHIESAGAFLTEIVMSNGTSFICGGRARDYEERFRRVDK